jgi:hypothetical protein
MLLGLVIAGLATFAALDRPAHQADVKPAVAADGTYTAGTTANVSSTQALAAATRALPQILAYDYRHLADNESSAAKLATTSFAATYKKSFDTAVKAEALRQQAITRALVRAAGVITTGGGGSSVRCLFYVDQLVVNSSSGHTAAATRINQSRVAVTMRRVDGVWLVDNVSPF